MKLVLKPSEYKKRNIAIWNEIAPRYHQRWANSNSGPFQSTKKLLELVKVRKGNKILDIACGTGVVTRDLIEKTGDSGYVVGVDTSTTAIRIATKWISKRSNLHFVIADAEKFSFKEKFDIITCQYALFFFPNALKALRKMRSSLKKSGTLGITVHGSKEKVPFFGSILDAITQFIPDYIPAETPSLDRYSTKKALRVEVKKAGYSNIQVKDYVFNYSPGNFENYWKNYLRYLAKPLKQKVDNLSILERKKLRETVRENTKP